MIKILAVFLLDFHDSVMGKTYWRNEEKKEEEKVTTKNMFLTTSQISVAYHINKLSSRDKPFSDRVRIEPPRSGAGDNFA